jgi:hypothetical protein
MLSSEFTDITPLILSELSDLKDILNVDLTCKTLCKINEDNGWKIFATKTMAFPCSYKSEKTCKQFLLKHVKPMHKRLVQICNIKSLRKRAIDCTKRPHFGKYNPTMNNHYLQLLKENTFPPSSEYARQVLQLDWPTDVGIFIACHCYLARAPIAGRSFFGFGYNESASTESFAFWDSFSLGGGDTEWWSYVVLKGTVKVPLAPKMYPQNGKREAPVEIGRGGIVAFSHWNHGGIETTPKHICPEWDPSEFGFDKCEYDEPCDEWIRVNLEEPVAASGDSPPCGWYNIYDFLDEVERCINK